MQNDYELLNTVCLDISSSNQVIMVRQSSSGIGNMDARKKLLRASLDLSVKNNSSSTRLSSNLTEVGGTSNGVILTL